MSYVLRRLGFFVVTLWAACTLNFIIPRLMPGNPAIAMMARFRGHVNPAAIKALEVAFGVDTHQNVFAAYLQYLHNCLTFNFGNSLTFSYEPVSQVVRSGLWWTVGLVGVTTVIAFVLGTLVGMIGAWHRGGRFDSVLPPVFIITSAIPYFWVALMSILVFSVWLDWLPASFAYDLTMVPSFSWPFIQSVLVHAILPAMTILVTSIGGWILTMRNNMITTLADDYVRMARAKGIKGRKIMWGYAGRNALLPNLSGFAMSLGFVVSGAILTEYVFDYPGLGWMLLQAVENQDYPLMQALFLLITLGVLVAVLLADFVTLWLDPRTRASA